MNQLKGMRPCRVLAMIAMLFAAMITTVPLPAYGQQEVDPTWYNPWAAPNTAVVHSDHPQAAMHRHQAALKRVSTAPDARKFRGKRPTATTEAVLMHPAK